MSKVITVSRELGSGGREVGLRLAKKLGIPFYDKELIAMAAEDSNISEDLFHANDEVIAGQKRINYDDYATVDPFSPVYEVPVSDQLFVIQSKIIQRLAANGPCVIIGRCSDVIVEDAFRIFICVWSGSRDLRRSRRILKSLKAASVLWTQSAGITTSITAEMSGANRRTMTSA